MLAYIRPVLYKICSTLYWPGYYFSSYCLKPLGSLIYSSYTYTKANLAKLIFKPYHDGEPENAEKGSTPLQRPEAVDIEMIENQDNQLQETSSQENKKILYEYDQISDYDVNKDTQPRSSDQQQQQVKFSGQPLVQDPNISYDKKEVVDPPVGGVEEYPKVYPPNLDQDF